MGGYLDQVPTWWSEIGYLRYLNLRVPWDPQIEVPEGTLGYLNLRVPWDPQIEVPEVPYLRPLVPR